MEMELKSNYAKICGKQNNRNNTGDGNDSDSDESDDGDLEAYDGFTGETTTVETNHETNNDHSVDENGNRFAPV